MFSSFADAQRKVGLLDNPRLRLKVNLLAIVEPVDAKLQVGVRHSIAAECGCISCPDLVVLRIIGDPCSFLDNQRAFGLLGAKPVLCIACVLASVCESHFPAGHKKYLLVTVDQSQFRSRKYGVDSHKAIYNRPWITDCGNRHWPTLPSNGTMWFPKM